MKILALFLTTVFILTGAINSSDTRVAVPELGFNFGYVLTLFFHFLKYERETFFLAVAIVAVFFRARQYYHESH